MCGLIGALLAQPSPTDARIAQALATIAHRGPDHTGWWCSPDRRMVLGHVRLSSIELDNGDQPRRRPDALRGQRRAVRLPGDPRRANADFHVAGSTQPPVVRPGQRQGCEGC
jgi:asparagine synthetase B (glutamine-hydrolysing)